MSDDILNDGHNYKVGDINQSIGSPDCYSGRYGVGPVYTKKGDEGSYSRYFDLDSWYDELMREG